MTAIDDPPGPAWDPDQPAPHHTDADYHRAIDPDWDHLEGRYTGNGHRRPHTEGDDTAALFVDWASFFDRDRSEADYLLDDVIVRGRGHALYAPHKAGKSLFTLWACTEIIATHPDVVVVYLDYEMTEDDLQERLEDMGYGTGNSAPLARLRYWLLPTLAPLNTELGATELLNIVRSVGAEHPDHHIAVIIDTTSRAVAGEENDSGPYRDFYRLTGMRLKQMGVTWARLDHEGKDPGQGQRGSSAKGDDIDVAWRIAPTEGGVTLTRKLSRLSWVPDKVAYLTPGDPLRYVRTGDVWPAGTKEVVAVLDELEVAATASANAAQRALRENDQGRTRQLVQAAQRWRKMRDDGTATDL